MPAIDSPGERRLAAVSAILADEFGMAIDRFSPGVVRLLLETLPAELDALDSPTLGRIAMAFSVGETFFMRHPEQFEALRTLLGELPSARAAAPLNIWSAGCATGEETYSLAATLASANYAGRVLGTDINRESLAKADAGHYRLWSLRGDAPVGPNDWLQVTGTDVVIDPRLRDRVAFGYLNLMRDPYPRNLDAILCRNVLLYFNAAAAQSVYRRMAEAVREGGILIIGYTDPEPGSTLPWRQEEIGKVRIFRKRARPGPGVPDRLASPPRLGESSTLRAVVREDDGPPAGRLTPAKADGLEAQLAAARGLSSAGFHREALAAVEESTVRHPLRPEPWILGAMIAEESGEPVRALGYARKAHLLIPDSAIACYLLATCLSKQGETGRARALLVDAAKDLFARAPGEPVACGEGLTVKQLARMVEMETLRHG